MIDSPTRPGTEAPDRDAGAPDALAARAEVLRRSFRAARAAGAARHRDIAASLLASEAELIAAHVGVPAPSAPGLAAVRLKPEWNAIVAALTSVGTVMALTRNESCVHEKTGRYEDVGGEGPVGLVLGPDIDLRVFYRAWAHGFAVDEADEAGTKPPQRSLQFFDAAGTAVHKVFAKPGTDLAAWQALVDRFRADDQSTGILAGPATPREPDRPDAEIDVPAFREAWASMRDTHEFFGLLRRHGVGRVQALRLAEPRFVQPVEPGPGGAARELLERAAADHTPIMVFVGNPGMIQIHTGTVRRVQVLGPWVNVLDPGFNLHLREDHIASAWVVRKPTTDGLVTSLELFDAEGNTIAMLFGERKPGRAELCCWRQVVAEVLPDRGWMGEHACAAC